MEEDYLIRKWLENDLTAHEKTAFEALDYAPFYNRLIATAQDFKAGQNSQVPKFTSIEQNLQPKGVIAKNNQVLRWFSAAAAVVLIVFLGYSYLNSDGTNTYATTIAENLVIDLPDDSSVTLNESSEISFSDDTWGDERRINLLGEAFFEVEKGRPFRVVTTQGVVEVLGTSFNVKTRDSLFAVVCYEGLVRVNFKDSQIMLPAGQSLYWRLGEAIKENIYRLEPTWLNNRTVFKAAPLQEVVIALERQFNVRIDYPQNTDLSFTGTFEHDDLQNALKMVFPPLNLTYTIEDNTSVTVSYE